jgi:DNA-binding response OmpR family regulator
LVDDEEAVLDVFRALLTRSNFVVDCARNLSEAETHLITHQYSLAVLDLSLAHGEAEGISVLDYVVRQPARPKVVVWSGYTSQDVKEKTLVRGADVFLPKPVVIRTLLGVISGLLESPAHQVSEALPQSSSIARGMQSQVHVVS